MRVTTDERDARALRERVDAAVPRVEVDVERVIPRARRRRAVVRTAVGATTLSLVLAAGAGAVAVLDLPSSQELVPAGAPPAQPAPTTPPEPSDAPRPVPATAVVADDGTATGVPGDPWDGADRYWYQLIETRGPDGDVEQREVWASRERPGLLLWDGNLQGAAATGPRVVIGSWVVAGVRHEMLADPRVLPTDAEELLRTARDSVQPDRGSGSDDDKVVDSVLTALGEGGLYDAELRDGLWGALVSLSGGVPVEGEDSAGRPGEVLTLRTSDGTEHRLVRARGTGLLLEVASSGGSATRYLEQRSRDDVPIEPTLEIAGCASWATC